MSTPESLPKEAVKLGITFDELKSALESVPWVILALFFTTLALGAAVLYLDSREDQATGEQDELDAMRIQEELVALARKGEEAGRRGEKEAAQEKVALAAGKARPSEGVQGLAVGSERGS
eukprot:CAMPEP_0172624568 /NCGR_PEP_ID=MMETSP1068-20121228/137640_1 /TAXON_ID=35684 /ORGANISM="Pseudopedinella elastica, Strain CCMP716" /LENGTH=119 /DNA_ID=CAMNT_0013433579 /DNA_START=157 /DNA_END=513 /DNA_ORIENTATION=-